MKAAAFDYVRAESVEQACKLLAERDGEARLIAGGQTLVPLMAMRLARPELLIDINHIEALKGIRVAGDTLVIGAATRQADVLASAEAASAVPLLIEGLSNVGHEQTRNRGTVGGSLANADPTAEIGLVTRTLGGEVSVTGSNGERRVPAEALFEAAMVTTLEIDEVLTALHLPIWTAPRTGHGFHETGIRHGDFAIAAAAAQLSLDASGKCERIHVGVGAGRRGDRGGGRADPRPAGARIRYPCRRRAAPPHRGGHGPPRHPDRPRPGEGQVIMSDHDITLTVNGRKMTGRAEARTTLVDFLRDNLGLTGTHVGCEHGVCGACSVILDGRPIRSCLTYAVMADGAEITTVEGLEGPDGALSPLQDAFWEQHAMQCGYCTPGMLIAATALLDRNPDPSEEEIRDAIGGNLCRCTGYVQIVEAVQNAARAMREAG
jgi:aerobic-type carbon monoxide dehydrogenase small subunit (CoxS/CutS family)/CO/xanthine dehydrogenase FAD-binding subunit